MLPIEVSVVIVTYNSSRYIKECLEAVAQNRFESKGVIVVDNNSQDDTVKIVEDMGYSVIRNSWNRNYTEAVNQGIRLSEGRYILTLNPDTRIGIDTIFRMRDFMELEKKAGACGPNLYGDNGNEGPGHRFITPLWAFLELSKLNAVFPNNPVRRMRSYQDAKHIGNAPKLIEATSGACLMIRREAWEEVGEFDEGFEMYCEETDWCKRAKNKGWTTWHLPNCFVWHYGGGSGESSKNHLGGEFDFGKKGNNESYRKASIIRYLKKHWLKYSPCRLDGHYSISENGMWVCQKCGLNREIFCHSKDGKF